MRWAVEIQRTSLDRQNVEDLLRGLGFDVVDTDQGFAFTSEQMDCSQVAADAFELAKKVRAAMTGPSEVDPEFQLGSVWDFSVDPPRRHAILEAQGIVIRAFLGRASLSVGPPNGLTSAELQEWEKRQAEAEYEALLERQRAKLEPAFRSERASKVLELLAKDIQTGETLYKIYELAEGHPSNRKSFQMQLNIDRTEFQRFKDAVHNPAVSGDWARHAYMDPPKSDRPMSPDEAEHFVRNIAHEWLASVRYTLRDQDEPA